MRALSLIVAFFLLLGGRVIAQEEQKAAFVPPGDELLTRVVDARDILFVIDATITKSVRLEDQSYEWNVRADSVTCDPERIAVGRQLGEDQIVSLSKFLAVRPGDEFWLTNEDLRIPNDNIRIVILVTDTPGKGLMKVFDNH